MHLIYRALAVGLATVWLAGCASIANTAGAEPVLKAEPFDPFTLEIEAGRWGAMNAQMAEIVNAIPASAHPIDDSDVGRRQTLAEELRLEVFDLARLKATACPDEKLSKAACGAEFSPDWALRREAEPVSWAELQKRSDAVGDAVTPVWNEVCAAAKERAGPQKEDEMICPME